MNGSSRKFKNRETVFQLPKLVVVSACYQVVVLFCCVNCCLWLIFFWGGRNVGNFECSFFCCLMGIQSEAK